LFCLLFAVLGCLCLLCSVECCLFGLVTHHINSYRSTRQNTQTQGHSTQSSTDQHISPMSSTQSCHHVNTSTYRMMTVLMLMC
jgi:hypothetical protein